MSNSVGEMNGGYAKLTDKNGVELYMLKEADTAKFRIAFDLVNPNYDLNKAIGFKLFALMAQLNSDVIESCTISSYDDSSSEVDMGLLFRRFGSDFGLAQKYIYAHSVMRRTGLETTMETKQIQRPDDFTVPRGSEPALGSASNLVIRLTDNHHGEVLYDFVLVLEEDVPIYMEKMPGSLMHKVFSRLKVFIETLV